MSASVKVSAAPVGSTAPTVNDGTWGTFSSKVAPPAAAGASDQHHQGRAKGGDHRKRNRDIGRRAATPGDI